MKYVKDIGTTTRKEIAQTGGKAAMLGELTWAGFDVPPGFCVSGSSRDEVVIESNWGLGESVVPGEGQDFEWDYEEDELFFLQSRKTEGLK